MATQQPGIGDWYRLNGGALFEVVALDDDDGTIEIQYFDGTVEEMDIEDWVAQWDEGTLESAEAARGLERLGGRRELRRRRARQCCGFAQ